MKFKNTQYRLFSKEWDSLPWGASELFYLRVSGIPLPLYAPGPSPRVLGLPYYGGQASTWPPEPFLPSFDRLFSIGYPVFLLRLQSSLCYWVFLLTFSSDQTLKNSGASLSDLKNYSVCSVPNTYTGFL